MKKIAVILCGSGFKDGSEIRESVGVLWALSGQRAEVVLFALDEPQFDVVNCLTGEVEKESRNQLVEAARIARGNIKPLSELNVDAFDGIIMPGGFGAAKNLCNFAQAGADGKVHALVEKILKKFLQQKKPIGAVCIAPAILALVFKGSELQLTVGEASDAASAIEALGHRHVIRKANEWHVDSTHRVVTTPAYMYDDAPLHEVFDGIRGLVNEVIKLA